MTPALRTGATIEQEWSVRLPNETQPEFQALFDANPNIGQNGGTYHATLAQVRTVGKDCEFMLHPDGPDLTAAECRAYANLLKQCCAILDEVASPSFPPKASGAP